MAWTILLWVCHNTMFDPTLSHIFCTLRRRNLHWNSVITTRLWCSCVCHRFPPKHSEPQCWLSLPLYPWDLIQSGTSLWWYKVPFLQPWCLGVAVTIEARRGLKGSRADWEMGHIICPWNIMWHNMTPGHLYVKVNISAWRFDKSGQGSCQCGFILTAEKEVLWHRVAEECVCGTLWVCVCECIELLFTNLIPIDTSHLVRSEKVLSGLFSCSSLFLLKALTDCWSQSFTKTASWSVCVCRRWGVGGFTCTGNSFNLKKWDCQTTPNRGQQQRF